MTLDIISRVSQTLLGIISFIYLTKDTKVTSFFQFMHAGAFQLWVIDNYNYFAAVLAVGIALQWITDWRWLAGIATFVFLFTTFVI